MHIYIYTPAILTLFILWFKSDIRFCYIINIFSMYLLICLFNNIIYMTWDPIFGLHCCEIHMSYLYIYIYMCVCLYVLIWMG